MPSFEHVTFPVQHADGVIAEPDMGEVIVYGAHAGTVRADDVLRDLVFPQVVVQAELAVIQHAADCNEHVDGLPIVVDALFIVPFGGRRSRRSISSPRRAGCASRICLP